MYKFKKSIDDFEYNFITKYGLNYSVQFSTLDFIFEDNPLKDLCFELSIALKNKTNNLPSEDVEIAITIYAIIHSFFEEIPTGFLIYYVAAFDGKASLRNRKFNHWFNKYAQNHLEKIERLIRENHDTFYFSVIFRPNNIYKSLILTTFDELLDDLDTQTK